MKKQKPRAYSSDDKDLFWSVKLMLESDLANPKVETAARKLLKRLRDRGYSFSDFDVQDPDCLSCLDLALLSAADLAPEGMNQQILH